MVTQHEPSATLYYLFFTPVLSSKASPEHHVRTFRVAPWSSAHQPPFRLLADLCCVFKIPDCFDYFEKCWGRKIIRNSEKIGQEVPAFCRIFLLANSERVRKLRLIKPSGAQFRDRRGLFSLETAVVIMAGGSGGRV